MASAAVKFDVEVTHLDGTTETVTGADTCEVRSNVLVVAYNGWNTGMSGYFRRDLGSFPLASIRKWRRL